VNLKELGRTAKYEVALLAGLCGVCERTLQRYMAVDYGETPSSWLQWLQISDSILLLCKGMKIKEVAADLHFENATHFARAFRRHIGFSPSQFYRLWIRNGRENLA
jgi:AraC-like DNA-binding protein